MESALCVKNRCGCGTGIFLEPKKGNVRRWKPVTDESCVTADREEHVRVIVDSVN
jgi:hypothetical protein